MTKTARRRVKQFAIVEFSNLRELLGIKRRNLVVNVVTCVPRAVSECAKASTEKEDAKEKTTPR